ncbi:hypothetical protein SRHO_G00204460 [Serrasalmus rhombeus]
MLASPHHRQGQGDGGEPSGAGFRALPGEHTHICRKPKSRFTAPHHTHQRHFHCELIDTQWAMLIDTV